MDRINKKNNIMNYNWKLSEANFTKDKGKVFSCFANVVIDSKKLNFGL